MLAISIQTEQTQSVCVRLFCFFAIADYEYEMRLRSVETAFRGTNFSCTQQRPERRSIARCRPLSSKH